MRWFFLEFEEASFKSEEHSSNNDRGKGKCVESIGGEEIDIADKFLKSSSTSSFSNICGDSKRKIERELFPSSKKGLKLLLKLLHWNVIILKSL